VSSIVRDKGERWQQIAQQDEMKPQIATTRDVCTKKNL